MFSGLLLSQKQAGSAAFWMPTFVVGTLKGPPHPAVPSAPPASRRPRAKRCALVGSTITDITDTDITEDQYTACVKEDGLEALGGAALAQIPGGHRTGCQWKGGGWLWIELWGRAQKSRSGRGMGQTCWAIRRIKWLLRRNRAKAAPWEEGAQG
jgi:hypothetical protein